MTCPSCAQPLDLVATQTTAGMLCTCGHLWVVRDGQPVALNAGNTLLMSNPAPVVTAPAVNPAEADVMTATKAAPFIEEEVG